MKLYRYRLIRSHDGLVAGVFDGLGKYNGINPQLLRLIWLLSLFFYGSGFFFYILLAFLLPKEGNMVEYERPKALGVCLKISRYYSLELGLVRLIVLSSFFFSLGTTLFFYFIFWFFFPDAEDVKRYSLY